MTAIVITRAGPLVTVQDRGRADALSSGVSASGPMDRGAFRRAGFRVGSAGDAGIEFAAGGLAFRMEGKARAGFEGGDFRLTRNGAQIRWPASLELFEGDEVEIVPRTRGNYGYVRFDAELDLPLVLGSRSTNLTVGLGGLAGRALAAGDRIELLPAPKLRRLTLPVPEEEGAIRVIWGRHADYFSPLVRHRFVSEAFRISPRLDRMGVRLADPAGVFAGEKALSLVSDAVVAGDIQILGDDTPIVLMRDHQPTGGYPRIATIVSVDLDRFAQARPGTEVRFTPISVRHAHALLREHRQS